MTGIMMVVQRPQDWDHLGVQTDWGRLPGGWCSDVTWIIILVETQTREERDCHHTGLTEGLYPVT